MINKIIAVTQRKTIDGSFSEVRDSLDQRWSGFFIKCGYVPILLPNNIKLVEKIFSQIVIHRILLSGGGDIESCGGDDFQREEVENYLIKKTASNSAISLIGVCRGMQKIQDFFGIKIYNAPNNVAEKQEIFISGKLQQVNSFHNFGTKENNDKEFEVFAIAQDGIIKGVRHKKHNIAGIMWHPERINPYRQDDIDLFHEVLK